MESLIQIDTDGEIQKIMDQLNTLPDKIAAPRILTNAVNATARKVRRQFVKGAKEQYALKNKKVLNESQGGPKVHTATQATITAEIRSKGGMQDIMTFLTRPNTETGAAEAHVLSENSEKSLEIRGLKAFVTRFASGHTAIVQRTGEDRLPVKKLLSPAVPHMLGNEAVREQAEKTAYETLQAEIGKQIEKVLGRM